MYPKAQIRNLALLNGEIYNSPVIVGDLNIPL
jgi:hypothetical protein